MIINSKNKDPYFQENKLLEFIKDDNIKSSEAFLIIRKTFGKQENEKVRAKRKSRNL